MGPEYALFQKQVNIKRNFEIKKNIVTFYNGASGSVIIYKNIINQLVRKKNIIINIIVGPYSKENIQNLKYFNRYKNINIISNKFGINKTISSSRNRIKCKLPGTCAVRSFPSEHKQVNRRHPNALVNLPYS